MIPVNLPYRLMRVAVALALCTYALPARAQEVSESHVKAARAAVDAINATDSMDGILPQAALALKQEMIGKNPDLEQEINRVVDESTLALAARRADLEREAALVYSRVFTEADLNAISAFYNSDAGKKLLANGSIVAREVDRAAQIWQAGVARDLAQSVGETLKDKMSAAADTGLAVDPAATAADPAAAGTAPADPAEPAAAGEAAPAPAN